MRNAQNKKGCLFYGCLTFVLIAIAAVVGTYFGVRKVMNTYTSNKPAPLPASNYSREQYDQLASRLQNYYTNHPDGAAVELSADEVNALLQNTAALKKIGDHFWFQIESNQAKAQVSFALGDLGATQYKDRYINGTADMDIKVTNGVAVLHAKNFKINGNPMPDSLSAAIQAQNLATDINNNPDWKKTLSEVKRLEIKDGKVVIELNKQEPAKP
jgi:hypothetical protein